MGSDKRKPSRVCLRLRSRVAKSRKGRGGRRDVSFFPNMYDTSVLVLIYYNMSCLRSRRRRLSALMEISGLRLLLMVISAPFGRAVEEKVRFRNYCAPPIQGCCMPVGRCSLLFSADRQYHRMATNTGPGYTSRTCSNQGRTLVEPLSLASRRNLQDCTTMTRKW